MGLYFEKGINLKPVITTKDSDTKNVFIIVQELQPLRASGSREARSNVYLSNTADANITFHHTPADKRLVLLWLIESPHQRPNLMIIKSESVYVCKSW